MLPLIGNFCILYCIFIGWQNYSLLFCLVVALDIKMCEIDGNSPLWWGNDLPDTILVAWVYIWEWGTRDCTIRRVNDSSTCILTSALIWVKFITDSAWTGIASKSIDAFVFTPMIGSMAFIILLNWKSWPNQIWNWETGLLFSTWHLNLKYFERRNILVQYKWFYWYFRYVRAKMQALQNHHLNHQKMWFKIM